MTGVLIGIGVYLAIGAVFALAFAWRGAAAIDPLARGAGLGFRLLVLPGAAALWPMLLGRWVRAARNSQPTAPDAPHPGSAA